MKKLLLGKVIAIIVIVGVVGAVTSLYFHFWNPSWNPFTEKPEVVLAKMIKNVKKVKTYHIEGKGGINFKTEEAQYSPKIEIELNGDEDQNDENNHKSYSDIKGSLSVQGIQFKGEIEGAKIGETSYFKVKKFPFAIFSFYSGEDLNGLANLIENKWIKVDPESLKRFYESQGVTGFPENKEKQKEMIEKIMNIIKSKQWVKAKENKGKERIDGKNYYHFLLIVDKEALKQSLPEIIKIGMEYSPSSLPLTSQQINEAISKVTKNIDELFQKTGDIDFDIWIGARDKLPYKISFERKIDLRKFNIDGNNEPNFIKGLKEIDIKGNIVFSDFNEKVEIKEPKSYKTFEEIMSELNRGHLYFPSH